MLSARELSSQPAKGKVGFENGCQVYRLGSGSYRFTTKLKTTAIHLPSATEGKLKANPIYDLQGRYICTDLDQHNLKKGIYIVKGDKSKTIIIN